MAEKGEKRDPKSHRTPTQIKRQVEGEAQAAKPAAAAEPPAPPPVPEDVQLLREIRDSLKK